MQMKATNEIAIGIISLEGRLLVEHSGIHLSFPQVKVVSSHEHDSSFPAVYSAAWYILQSLLSSKSKNTQEKR